MVVKKITTILAVVISIIVCPVYADLVFSSGYNIYDDSYGYRAEVWVENDAVLDVVGGEIGKLQTIDFATANLYSGDIYNLWVDDSSIAHIFGGEIEWLDTSDYSLVYLYAYDVTYHPTGGGYWGNRAWIEGTYFKNDESFNFVIGGSRVYSRIQVIPEPAMILLLSLGSLMVRKTR